MLTRIRQAYVWIFAKGHQLFGALEAILSAPELAARRRDGLSKSSAASAQFNDEPCRANAHHVGAVIAVEVGNRHRAAIFFQRRGKAGVTIAEIDHRCAEPVEPGVGKCDQIGAAFAVEIRFSRTRARRTRPIGRVLIPSQAKFTNPITEQEARIISRNGDSNIRVAVLIKVAD